ncbi:MAG TPA: PKD domain-containing protein [Bacteroidales bacterium]|nr:PKD domain-containing protein [Bacteroidales bacterium]HOL98821.1 PKD domain-containing protein [Bacteroidales bacterium]HUM32927.1 PKD domain-containing protein [Bacteroidales bacterium]
MNKLFLIYFLLFVSVNFVIAQIPDENLQLWLRADSVVANSNKVSRWYDLSSNNYLITQLTEINCPIVIENSLNNQPVIQFDGINDYLDGGDILNLGANSHTFFIVGKSNSNNGTFIAKSKWAAVPDRYALWFETGLFKWQYHDNSQKVLTSSFNTSQYMLITATNDRQNDVNNLYKNSVFLGQIDIANSYNINSLNNFLIGAYNNSSGTLPPKTGYYLNGEIGEIIIYDSLLNTLQKEQVENYLMDKYSPPLFLGEDITISYGLCDTLLIIDSNFTDITWSTGETNDTIYINESGQYWVQATDIFGRVKSDTINVQFSNLSLQNSSICLGDSVLYSPGLIGTYDYLWSDLGSESSKYFKDAGDYWLRMEDTFGCFDTVFFSVEVDSFKNNISLGNDTSLCSGNTISLIDGAELCSSFLWSTNGNTNPIQTVNETGWQKIIVENTNGCSASDSIYVTIVGTAPTPGYIVENLCFGDTTQFIDNSTPQADIVSWKWIINENDTLYTQNVEWLFSEIGIQNIQLIVESLAGCTNSVDFDIEILDVPEVSYNYSSVCVGTPMIFIPEVIPPSENTVTSYSWLLDGFEISNVENLEYVFEETGLFELVFTSTISNGCSSSYVSEVAVLDSYPIAGDFTLVSPHDCYYYSKNEVLEFQWNNSTDAASYKILLSGDQNFQENIYSQSNLDTNQITIPLSILIDTIYWQVQSVNPCGVITSSDVRKLILFDYSTIANVALWLAADSTDAISNKVSKWYDLSPNMFEILQDNDEFKPVILDNILKNKPVLDFDGIDDYLDGGNILNLGSKSNTFIFIAQGQKTIFAKSRASGYPNRYAFMLNLNRIENLYHDNILRSYVYNDISFNNLDYNFYKIENQRNTSENKYYLNNSLIGSASINGIHNLSSEYNFLIGAYNNSLGGVPPLVHATYGYLDGSIAELIIIDSLLSESDYALICNYLRDKYSNPVNLSYDIRVPYGFCDTAITTAYKPWFTSYEWSTGETDSIIYVNKPGLYSCTVTDIFGFESSDDIRVFYPPVNNFADTIACYGNSVIWDAELTGDYSYEWLGSPETTQSIEIFYEGDYALIITDSLGCKYYSDTINFSFDKYELTASIGPADTLLCAGNRLSLATNSDETVSYLWSTGAETPEITLSESGTYSVTCTNWRACSAKDEIAVTIMGTVPNPDFSVQGHCAKNIISFSDLSTSQDGNINYWRWSVNGEEFANSQNSEIILEEAGIYNINLEIKTDADCGDYLIKNIEVFPLPEPKFFPDYYCQWAEIDFISKTTILSGNILNNYWQFNDFDLFGDTVSYVFENSGINTVKLISESEQACRDSIIKEIFVKQAVKPDFLSQNACVNSESSFINITEQSSYNLPVSWNWNFGDGNFGENSDPSHVYENSGIYDVSLSVVWQNTCETSITKQIEIYDNPELELLVENSCVNSEFTVAKNIESQSGEIVEYIWNFNGNEIISNTDASPTFVCDTIGEYPISLEIKSEYGCEAFAQDTIKVYPLPQVDFAMSRDWGGFPFTVDFTNLSQGASQYLWSFGDSESSIEENPTHIYISEGEFFVNLTAVSEYGCSDYIEKKIISVNPIMDLILYDLRTKLNGNYLEISVYIINNGTLPVSKPELVLNLGEGKIYRESLDSIPVSQVIDYTLKTEIWRAEKTLPEIICLEVFANPYEGHYENNTEDNLICSANVKNLLVFQPYPNPTNQSLNIEYILAKPAECLITITNSMGKQVYVNKFENQTQYNKLELDVSEFAVGVYYLQVQSGGERESRKVEVY